MLGARRREASVSRALPLSDVRVLDLTRLLPGGFCCSCSPTSAPTWSRSRTPGWATTSAGRRPYYGDEEQQGLGTRSALYLSLNRNKRSIRLDLKSDGGREALLRLVRDFDVVLEGFRPGVLDRLGVGYERMKRGEPARSSTARSPATARPVRTRSRAGHDMNYLGLIGLLGLTGEPERQADPVGGADRRPRRRRADGRVRDDGGAARGAALGRGPGRRRLDGRRGALLAGDGRGRLPVRRRGSEAGRGPADGAVRLLPALRGGRRPHHDGRARAAVLGALLRRRRTRGPGREAVRAPPARRPGPRSRRSSARARAPSGRRSTTSTTR